MCKILSDLIDDLECEVIGYSNVSVHSIVYDSRAVREGDLFVCIRGAVSDAHQYIIPAINAGAKVIIIQKNQTVFSESQILELSHVHGVSIVVCKNTRLALAQISAAFYDHSDAKMTLLGVTGTKGKTTTTFMIHEILTCANIRAGLIGTVSNIIDGASTPASRTTPEAIDLWRMFKKMTDVNTQMCVMEVSSLGLAFDRVAGCHFKAAGFTNLFPDHISDVEHKDMDDYLNAKMKIFDHAEYAVVNADTEVSEKVAEYTRKRCKTVLYGLSDHCDCRAKNIQNATVNGVTGSIFELSSPWFNGSFFVALPGDFNVYNALCAIAVCALAGVPVEAVKEGLAQVLVPGRLQMVPNNKNITVLVDYAHNAASLETILKTLRNYTHGRLITVFGCGGNRSKTRRTEMGEVSGRLSDLSVITSDNPRKEDPQAIIADILEGMNRTSGQYRVESDRTTAISIAVDEAQAGDIVIIAGKGHETYQIFKDRTIHFDDAEVANEILQKIDAKRE